MNKLQILNQQLKEVRLIIDGLGKPVDRGIRKTVALMWLHGFKTIASCQGHENWGLKTAWIDFIKDDRIQNLLDNCFGHQLDYFLGGDRLFFYTKEALIMWNKYLYKSLNNKTVVKSIDQIIQELSK